MSIRSRSMPDFAGVALVDILANGVAVLIIVIVITIAVRSETEQQLGEQAREIATVMTREFSTSLILNRLAASPPALLHDYERSSMDLIWDPFLLPILEFHQSLLRDPYSGETWSRAELLREPNGLDDFLNGFTPDMKARVRVDMYDVGTFYLAMSILRDHGIIARHWHFVGASRGSLAVNSCPPGVAAKDCAGTLGGGGAASAPSLQEALGQRDATENTDRADAGGWDWEAGGQGSSDGQATEKGGKSGSASGLGGQMPGGIALGPGNNASPSESFPDAGQSSGGSGGTPTGGNASDGTPSASLLMPDGSATLRLAISGTAEGQETPGLPIENSQSIEGLLAALLLYLGDLQDRIDSGESPTLDLLEFQDMLTERFERLDELTDKEKEVIEYLASMYDLLAQQGGLTQSREEIEIATVPVQGTPEVFLRLLPNRTLLEAAVGPGAGRQEFISDFAPRAHVRLNLNAFPGVWQGLRIDAYRGSVLLMPPEQTEIRTPKWRSVAYLSPILDDLVVGFVYGTFDEDGALLALADSNSVQIGTRQIASQFEASWFHVKSWLVVLYILLGICLLSLLFFWKPKSRANP